MPTKMQVMSNDMKKAMEEFIIKMDYQLKLLTLSEDQVKYLMGLYQSFMHDLDDAAISINNASRSLFNAINIEYFNMEDSEGIILELNTYIMEIAKEWSTIKDQADHLGREIGLFHGIIDPAMMAAKLPKEKSAKKQKKAKKSAKKETSIEKTLKLDKLGTKTYQITDKANDMRYMISWKGTKFKPPTTNNKNLFTIQIIKGENLFIQEPGEIYTPEKILKLLKENNIEITMLNKQDQDTFNSFLHEITN